MKYKLIENIDNGGFGIVDLVKGEDGILYARKTFNLEQHMIDMGLEENAKKRFKQEAKFQSEINHLNVVPVLELFLEEDPPYFIMPLAESSLEKDVRKKTIDSSNFMDPILDILSGLEEIHSLDIFHHDLKPSNVLRFQKEDGTNFYAIGDFGLMSLQQRTGVTILTTLGMGKTSDFYTAPEIVVQLRNASAASDIYSVGCIIHDFVGTGSRVPNNEIIEKSEYGEILSFCTKREPRKRFKSIESLRDALATIDTSVFVSTTEIGLKISEYLDRDPVALSESEVEEIIEYIEDESESLAERKNAILKLDFGHIKIIKTYSIVNRFGSMYCDFIKDHSFQWGSCDALASRINMLIDEEGLSLQTEGIMALLYLGTSHNRWYVERMFANKVTHDMNSKLATRLKMQFILEDERICGAFSHLTRSIGYSYSSLHPVLLASVKKICKH